jgi:hypothetical protein
VRRGNIPSLFLLYLKISKILHGGITHYIVTRGRLCGVRPAVPPAAKPVNPTCPSAEEVHASKGSFQKLIRSSPSECGAGIEIRYRDRICGLERKDEVEREVVFLSMTSKLRIPCRINRANPCCMQGRGCKDLHSSQRRLWLRDGSTSEGERVRRPAGGR